MASRIVLAVDEGGEALARALADAGLETVVCNPAQALTRVRELEPAACLLAVASESDLEASIGLLAGSCPTLAVVPAESPELALATLQAGARAILPDPPPPLLALASLQRELLAAGRDLEREESRARLAREDELVLQGDSRAVRRLREDLDRVAREPLATVLVQGDRGVGKLAVARNLQRRSPRADGPCMVVHGAELQDSVSAQALFGAPSSGQRGRLGRIEGGTLILSDVDRLGEPAQGALAAFLADRTGRADVRLIAATERDLELEVDAGRLREELAYRLNVLSLRVPTLAERIEDVPTLARGAYGRAAAARGRPGLVLEEQLAEELAGEPWPGNLGELELHIRRHVLTSEGSTRSRSEAEGVQGDSGHEGALTDGAPALSLRGLRLVDAEEALIRRVLAETGGNKLRAAEILGIHRTTLYSKLKSLGIA